MEMEFFVMEIEEKGRICQSDILIYTLSRYKILILCSLWQKIFYRKMARFQQWITIIAL
jgi:hypothetical protein